MGYLDTVGYRQLLAVRKASIQTMVDAVDWLDKIDHMHILGPRGASIAQNHGGDHDGLIRALKEVSRELGSDYPELVKEATDILRGFNEI